MRILPVSKLLLRVLGPIQDVQRQTSVILLLKRADVMWECCIGWTFRPANPQLPLLPSIPAAQDTGNEGLTYWFLQLDTKSQG